MSMLTCMVTGSDDGSGEKEIICAYHYCRLERCYFFSGRLGSSWVVLMRSVILWRWCLRFLPLWTVTAKEISEMLLTVRQRMAISRI